jgi:hypothetical protein
MTKMSTVYRLFSVLKFFGCTWTNKTGQLKSTSQTYSHQTGSTARGINKWKKTKLVNLALQLAVVKEVMFRLESTKENRYLTQE